MPPHLGKLGSDSEDDRQMCRQLISHFHLVPDDPNRRGRDRATFLDLPGAENAHARQSRRDWCFRARSNVSTHSYTYAP